MSTTITSPEVATPRVKSRRMLLTAGSVAAAFLVWVLAVPVAGVDLVVDTNGVNQPIHPVMVIASSLFSALAAWALLALLERFTKSPKRTWTIIAVIVLALSFAPLVNAIGTGTMVTLLAMHVVMAVILIPGFSKTARQSSPTQSGSEPL